MNKKSLFDLWLTLSDWLVWIGFIFIVIFGFLYLSGCNRAKTDEHGNSTSVLRCAQNGCHELDGTICWGIVHTPEWGNAGVIGCEDEMGNEYIVQPSCMCWIQEQ